MSTKPAPPKRDVQFGSLCATYILMFGILSISIINSTLIYKMNKQTYKQARHIIQRSQKPICNMMHRC